MTCKSPSPKELQSIYKQLADLYARRSVIESLIRSLESYAECQDRTTNRARQKCA